MKPLVIEGRCPRCRYDERLKLLKVLDVLGTEVALCNVCALGVMPIGKPVMEEEENDNAI